MLNLGGLVPESVVDGPGIRFVVFAQGCPHNCPQCFNAALQDYAPGKLVTVQEIVTMLEQYKSHSITFSGGDPFEQVQGFTELAKMCRTKNFSIWSYTGYTYEELLEDKQRRLLLQEIDVLVDGRFVIAQKDISLFYRGSSNQRLIDVQASLSQGSVVLFDQ